MKNITWTLTSFTIPFHSPMKVGKETLKNRVGYYLDIKDQFGYKGRGELSPLLGLHLESLEEAKKELEEVLANHILKKINLINSSLDQLFQEIKLLPSVQYCLEETLFSLFLNKFPKKAKKLLKINSFNIESIAINGLYLPNQNHQQLVNEVEQFKKKGIKTLKVKVGRYKITEEIKCIQQLLSLYPFKLRLDANRSLNPSDYLLLAKNLPLSLIEYIEEPFKTEELLKLWPKLYKEYQIPLAIDESLELVMQEFKTLDQLLSFPGLAALIIKPSFYGSLFKVFSLIKKANQNSINIVISSAFYTKHAMKTCALLAHFQNKYRKIDAGLDTLKYLNDPSKTS